MFKFTHPLFLLLIPLLIVLFFIKQKRKVSAGVGFSEVSLLRAAAGRNFTVKIPPVLRVSALTLLTASLAGPVNVDSQVDIKASGIDIMIVVDVSTSMEALDFSTKQKKRNRLDAVKEVVATFIEDRPNDRIGLIAFAGRPYIVSPLTLDHSWLIRRLDALETGMIEDGTAIGSAIASGANHLRDINSKSRIMILLTDGENTGGKVQPETAAEAAAAVGVKMYTIGAGKKGKAPYERQGFFTTDIYYYDVKIDEEMLVKTAQTTGGKYFRAQDLESLENIYSEINTIEKTTRTQNKQENFTLLFMYPLVAGILLLVTELILSQTKFRKIS